MTLTGRTEHGRAEEERQGARDNELNEPLREALQFLKPWLANFKFTPSHAIFSLQDKLPEQAKDKDKFKAIMQLENKKQQKEAVRMFVDWLVELQADHFTLTTFLEVLYSDTPEHLHVHNMLCLCCLYLTSHQPLVSKLAQAVQDDRLDIKRLLRYLQLLNLLEPNQAPVILTMAESSSTAGQTYEHLAEYVVTCLFSSQARVLMEKFVDPNNPELLATPQGHRDSLDVAQQSGAIGGAPESTALDRHAEEEDIPDEESLTETEWEWFGPVAQFIDFLNSSKSNSVGDTFSGLESGAPSQVEKQRLDNILDSWRSRGGEMWPVVLEKLLEGASGQKELWKCGLDRHQISTLWKKAEDLIKNAVNQHDASEEDDGGYVATGHGHGHETCPKTLAPTNFTATKEWVEKNYEKMLPNLTFNDPYDDGESVVSTENNVLQRQRREEATSGVLREEEANQLKAGPITLRPYQDELLESARKGENVLIWLPTGTGKTYIVLKYAEEHLKGSENRKVGFIVPKVRLARQQYERFQAYLPKSKPHLKCGETSGTASSKTPLGDVLKTSSVVVMTAQCLVEAVESKKVTLDQFSLLVLDECHHTRGGHPLRTLMNLYMELKYMEPERNLPQIIGLTASPGVGKARGKNQKDAVTYLKHLCARLNVTHICNVRRNLTDLQEYVNQPKPIIHESPKRKVDKLDERIQELMNVMETGMSSHGDVEKYLRKNTGKLKLDAPAPSRGQDKYTQWLSDTETAIKEVEDEKAYRTLKAYIDMLRLCQECLLLNKDCDSLGALELLREKVDALHAEKPNKEQVDQDLMDLFERHTKYFSNNTSLDAEVSHKDCKNPKLNYLEKVLLKLSHGDQMEDLEEKSEAEEKATVDDSSSPATSGEVESADFDDDDQVSITSEEERHLGNNVLAMIFVRSLDLSLALLRWMQGHPKLRFLNPGRITGVNASVKDGGMTKSEVTEVMAKFNAGGHRLVICTSAAEEGLDFKACNLVIPYLYEASMVSMIQTRGRARQKNSMYCVMGEQTTDSTNKANDNVESEKVMGKAVKEIQHAVDSDPKTHKLEINKIQIDNWNSRWRKDVQERKRLRQQLPIGQYKIRCRGCRVPACTSEDIRILRKTNRVVIGEEFKTKYLRKSVESSQGKTYDKNIPRIGEIQCRCGYYWGIMVRDVQDDVEYPVIPIKRFIVEMNNGTSEQYEKWSQAFEVPDITDEDRKRHSDPLASGGDEEEAVLTDSNNLDSVKEEDRVSTEEATPPVLEPALSSAHDLPADVVS